MKGRRGEKGKLKNIKCKLKNVPPSSRKIGTTADKENDKR